MMTPAEAIILYTCCGALALYMPLGISCATRHSSPLGLADKTRKETSHDHSVILFTPRSRKNFLKFLGFDFCNLVL